MSTILAIDVAILLPRALRQSMAQLNAQLLAPPGGFRFDDTHLPHLSLAQQLVRTTHLAQVTCAVGAIIEKTAPLELRTASRSDGRTTTTLRVTPTAALGQLHGRLMDHLQGLEATDGDLAAFVDGDEPPRESDVTWVKEFRSRAAYARFDPHITLGVGTIPTAVSPTSFVATTIAMCHLGRFCTCRRILTEWTLITPGP